MDYVVLKKLSKKNNKPYYQVCEVENGKFKTLGFTNIVDMTQKKEN